MSANEVEDRPVGFIGMGNIGAPMAKRLLGWPGGLVVYDLSAKAMEPFADKGARAATSPADVASTAAVICIVVQNEAQVSEVLSGADGILTTAPAGTVVAVHSTISAEGAEALEAMAEPHGVLVVDAPVSGGGMGAHEGTLAVMAGGSDDALERCAPVFDRFASMVAHMGPIGAGTRTKIARNLITFASFAVVGEAQRLAHAAGLDLAKLGDVVRHSDRVTGGPGAIMLRPDAQVMADDDGLRPIFEHSATLGGKDLQLAAELGEVLGIETPFAELSAQWLRAALGLDPNPGAPS